MNSRQFLKEFEQSAERDALIDAVYDEFVAYCKKEGITASDISTPKLERLAEGFVQRGLGVPESNETLSAEDRYKSDVKLELLQDVDMETLEELGAASSGDELE